MFLGCLVDLDPGSWSPRGHAVPIVLPLTLPSLATVGIYTFADLCQYLSHAFVQVKVVATNLNAAEEALEAYQRQKQQRLNELPVVIPLKLHQVTPRPVTPRPGQKQCHTKTFPEKDLWLTSSVPLPMLGRPVYRTMSPTLLTHSDF